MGNLLTKFCWKRILLPAIAAFIITVILSLFLVVLIEWKNASFATETINVKNIVLTRLFEILFAGYICSSMIAIFQMLSLINRQLNAPLSSIQSELLRNQTHVFGVKDVVKIQRKLNALETGTRSILWEFDEIGVHFNNFEEKCITSSSTGCSGIHVCDEIIKAVKEHRRKRIIAIADCLIIKGNLWSPSNFFATETKRPSMMTPEDLHYYAQQKVTLKNKKVNTAIRLLILNKNDLRDEFTVHAKKEALLNFIKSNIEYNQNTQKEITLKIITCEDAISDMFSPYHLHNNLFDFVISQKGSKRTVFAQNTDTKDLEYLDSDTASENSHIQGFLDTFTALYSQSLPLKIKRTEIITLENIETQIQEVIT